MTAGLELFMGHACHSNLLDCRRYARKSDSADLARFKHPIESCFDYLGVSESENKVISSSPFYGNFIMEHYDEYKPHMLHVWNIHQHWP